MASSEYFKRMQALRIKQIHRELSDPQLTKDLGAIGHKRRARAQDIEDGLRKELLDLTNIQY